MTFMRKNIVVIMNKRLKFQTLSVQVLKFIDNVLCIMYNNVLIYVNCIINGLIYAL